MRPEWVSRTRLISRIQSPPFQVSPVYLLIKLILLFLFVALVASRSHAQHTAVYDAPLATYNRGLELFDKEKFASAQHQFRRYQKIADDADRRINAIYYEAVFAMELFNQDAVPLLKQVIREYAWHPKSKLARFQLAKWYYRNKDNNNAILQAELVDESYLHGNDLREFYFIKGYVSFKTEKFEQSKTAFRQIKDEKSKYYDAANYYYAYVSYRQQQYDEALEHFGRVKYNKTFGPLSGIYIAQIHFSRGEYKDVIAYCDTVSSREIKNDAAGLLGQSYYQLGEYDKALPYLEKFLAEPVL